jgi:hypothetical protein
MNSCAFKAAAGALAVVRRAEHAEQFDLAGPTSFGCRSPATMTVPAKAAHG